MKEINYQKILNQLVVNNHHELDKIEKVILDARKNSKALVMLSFEMIAKDSKWDASEKERLFRLFSYGNHRQMLPYLSTYGHIDQLDAACHMIIFGNLSGLTAYMNSLSQWNEINMDFFDYLNKLLALIHDRTESTRYNGNLTVEETFTKDEEILFMKAVLDSLPKEMIELFCQDIYVPDDSWTIENQSLFIPIIQTGNLKFIQEYLPYIHDLSPYLSYAVATRNKEVVQAFLDLGADINYYPKEIVHNLLTPLKTAIVRNDYEMVKFLLDHGAKSDLSVKDESFLDQYFHAPLRIYSFQYGTRFSYRDFVKHLHSNSLVVFDGYHRLSLFQEQSHCDPEAIQDIQFMRESTPLEFAITVDKDYKQSITRPALSFKGKMGNFAHQMKWDESSQKNRAEIIHLLFRKQPQVSSYTRLISTSLATKDLSKTKEYMQYILQNHVELDLNEVFLAFLAMKMDMMEKEQNVFLDFTKEYSKDLGKTMKDFYQIYFEERGRQHLTITPFLMNILKNIPLKDRKAIIIVPYVKDLPTLKEMIPLGFDIQQTTSEGNNILYYLLNRSISDSEKEVVQYLMEIDPTTKERRIDLTHKNEQKKNILYYLLERFDTKDERDYQIPPRVFESFSELESLTADIIDALPKEEVDRPEILHVLEERLNLYSSLKNHIDAKYVYQHHQKLMKALRKKMVFSDRIYEEIMKQIYPYDEQMKNILERQIQLGPTLDFFYEVLDKNNKIQTLSIEKQYQQYLTYLQENHACFSEYFVILKKISKDIQFLKTFYEENIPQKYDSKKYLEYVQQKYHVTYDNASSYLLLMILYGIQTYGKEKLPLILKACPNYDINTIAIDQKILLTYSDYLNGITHTFEWPWGDPMYPSNRYPADDISYDQEGYILFTGSLIHYAILMNDLELVHYLMSLGANPVLMIDEEGRQKDCSWNYVSSMEMKTLLEQEIGPKELSHFNPAERKYLLDL